MNKYKNVYNDGYLCYNYVVSDRPAHTVSYHKSKWLIVAFAIVFLHMGMQVAAQDVVYERPEVSTTTPIVEVVDPEPLPPAGDTPMDPAIYWDMVYQVSDYWGVDSNLINAIVMCENAQLIPNLQSRLYYTFDYPAIGIYQGNKEYSFGLVQINLHYNPHVTYEQASDPLFSLNYLAEKLSLGLHSQWASYTGGCYLRYM